ncbi:chaperonin 10-like protein [Ephemerocybe angulata]|uniref:Chaperonin 10-like protein n=1 Tax=Ephemerocybe angulata TaxID=980116 RepID=A0A8H6I4G8_9AGAR|nr:chaperonin 10-like protein [Tulosesus angulatus]
MATQKALVIPEKFKPFTITSLPIPSPGKQELLVKVKAAALNPGDWKIQKYGVMFTEYPAVSGYDITGEVVKLGDGVEGFEIGDRIVFASEFTTHVYGGFQQYALADAGTAAKIPASISYDEAATLPAGVSTAYVGLYDEPPRGLGLKSVVTGGIDAYKGHTIFIAGGSSSVGQVVIQLARLSGFTHIITTSSPKHTDYLTSLGATHIIDRSLPQSELKTAVASLSLPPIEYAYDSIGELETSFRHCLAALAPTGKVVSVKRGFESYNGEDLGERSIYSFTALKTVGVNPTHMKTLWPAVTGLLESKALVPQRFEILPGGLEGIVEGPEETV